MYTPYAYSKDTAEINEEAMLSVVNNLNKKYCNCPSGAAGKEVGYLCPGTSLDYVYDNYFAKYSYAWEIF